MIIVFPDLRGEASQGDFGKQLLTAFPHVRLVPILNGLSEDALQDMAKTLPPPFEPVLSVKPGVVAALREGFAYVTERYPTAPIVRLDTAEHPIDAIPTLVEQATSQNGVAIGDLQFNEKTLRSGSIDEFINLNLFPNLFHHFTSGKLALSGAYGFQAYAPHVCQVVFAAAEQVIVEAEKEMQDSLMWGSDAAMILAAIGKHIPTVVTRIPALQLRDRSREKIAGQLHDTLAVCCAANRLLHLTDIVPHTSKRTS